jgi:hypothetical protein
VPAPAAINGNTTPSQDSCSHKHVTVNVIESVIVAALVIGNEPVAVIDNVAARA